MSGEHSNRLTLYIGIAIVAAGALAFGSYLLVAMMLDEPGWALALALTIVALGRRYVAFCMST